MRSFITLNGKKSTEIAGLLIQSLPPISKPLMRTQTEEIDGRDGDIITNLGFSAYQKDITIGLYGNYDIDEVIAYFNSQGTVTFSNEPDKYYNYQIINQIDFERLLRYRTATVTMHCQPFKYSTTEGADILSSSDNFATLDQSINTDSQYFTYTSNVQDDVTATRNGAATGSKFFATYTMNIVQGITYYFRGTAASTVTMYGYRDRIWGTSAGFSGRKLTSYSKYTATYTGTLIIGFYGGGSDTLYIRDFYATNEAGSTVSGEGNFITLENTAEAPFVKLMPKGDIFQQTYGGDNQLNRATCLENYGLTWAAGANWANTNSLASDYIAVTIGQNFSMNFKAAIMFYDQNKTYLGCLQNNGTSIAKTTGKFADSFTVPSVEDICFMRLSFTTSANGNIDMTAQDIMVNKGTTLLPYEQYVGGVPSPNPDFPQDIKVVTGNQTVKVTGKNLFSGDYAQFDNTGGTGTAYAYFKLPSDGTYTITLISKKPVTATPQTYIGFTSTGGSTANPRNWAFRDGMSAEEAGKVFSITNINNGQELKYVSMYSKSESTLNWFKENFDIMLEKSTTASNYEPYQGQSYPLSLGDMELAAIGNYEDKLFKNTEDCEYYDSSLTENAWYKRAEIKKTAVSITGIATYQGLVGGVCLVSGKISASNVGAFTTKATFLDRSIQPTVFTGCFYENYSNFVFMGTADDTLIGLQEKYNDGTLYYVLATPTNTQITDQTLIAQLEAINAAHACKGRTHIIATAGSTANLPHIIEAEVLGSCDGTITNSGNYYARPKLTIFGSGDIGVYLNGVQLFQIALGNEGYITIDTNAMEAYQDTTDNLKNRLVTGDYNNFMLNSGDNEISFSGSVTMCVVENYSRWL